jgi:hypothetical protein
MSILRKLQAVLDSYNVPFEVLPHSETYTAQETAGSSAFLATRWLRS